MLYVEFAQIMIFLGIWNLVIVQLWHLVTLSLVQQNVFENVCWALCKCRLCCSSWNPTSNHRHPPLTTSKFCCSVSHSSSPVAPTLPHSQDCSYLTIELMIRSLYIQMTRHCHCVDIFCICVSICRESVYCTSIPPYLYLLMWCIFLHMFWNWLFSVNAPQLNCALHKIIRSCIKNNWPEILEFQKHDLLCACFKNL